MPTSDTSNIEDLYSTVDLYLAAYIMTRGQPLQRCAPTGKHPGQLAFAFDAEAKVIAEDWATDSVSPSQFTSAIRTLKNLCASKKRGAQ